MTLFLCLLLFQGVADPAAARRAYQEGRFAEAQADFAAALAAAGAAAPPQLRYDVALAALRAGDVRAAESAAQAAAQAADERGDAELAALCEFLLGNVAFLRCERAETLASLPDAEPTALDEAIARAESASRHWQSAAAIRADWPEARRNVERALRKLAQLRAQQDAARRDRPKEQPQAPQPLPAPPLELNPEQLARLRDRLEQMEREKRQQRGAQPGQSSGVERDW